MTRDEEMKSRRRERLNADEGKELPPSLAGAVVSGRHAPYCGVVGAWLEVLADEAKPHTEMSNYERYCGIHDRVSAIEEWLEAALDQGVLAEKEVDLDGIVLTGDDVRAMLSWLSYCAINARDEELTVARDRDRLEAETDALAELPEEVGDKPF